MLGKISLGLILLVEFIGAEDHWKFKVEYKASFNLTCYAADNMEIKSLSNGKIQWIIPSGDLIDGNDPHDRVGYHYGGQVLRVKELDDEDFGNYYCLTHDRNGKYTLVKKGINVDGPFWGDLSAKYKQGIIIGAIAASIVFVLMIGICYLFDRHPVLIGRDSAVMGDYIDSKPVIENKIMLHTQEYDNAAIEMEDAIKKTDVSNGKNPPSYSTIADVVIADEILEEDPNTRL